MSNLAHDFKNFARYFPSMPIHWVVLHYAKRHLKSHRRIPPDMAFMLTYVMWADKKIFRQPTPDSCWLSRRRAMDEWGWGRISRRYNFQSNFGD